MSTYQRSFGVAKLVALGPLIGVNVEVPSLWAMALRQRGVVVPTSIAGEAPIDTGSTISAIDANVLDRLGLPAIKDDLITTPTGVSRQTTHPAQVSFVEAKFPELIANDWVSANLAPLGVIAILGRNVLARFRFTYDGLTGSIALED